MLPELSDDELHLSDAICDTDQGSDIDYEGTSSKLQRLEHKELSDLIRDLSLSKDASELLSSRLNDKNLLDQGTLITFYSSKETDLLSYFFQERGLVFRQDFK